MADAGTFLIKLSKGKFTATGAGEYYDGDAIRFSCTPDDDYMFVNWTLVTRAESDPVVLGTDKAILETQNVMVNGINQETVILSTSSSFSIDTSRSSIFVEGNEYTIYVNVRPKRIFSVNANSEYGTPYISSKKVREGDSVTIRAREYGGVIFTHWSDGSIEPERIFIPTSDVDLYAYYSIKTISSSTNYHYRAYVKDAKSINSLPKAFLIIRYGTISEDLMANTTSYFTVMEVPEDINNGDVMVVYNPKGRPLYAGVIKQIEKDSITTTQMTSFYSGNCVFENITTATTIESEAAGILQKFANGYVSNSPYQDTLMYQEKAPLKIVTGSSTSGNLETFDTNAVGRMDSFLYDLYSKYEMVLNFKIPYGAWEIGDDSGGICTISVPSYGSIKIGDNTKCVQNMSPITQTEEDNKLVVFAKNGTYRATYYATTTNGIVKEPPNNSGRFPVINTVIIFSDDDIDDIVSSNLPTEMYNHHLTFDLVIDNKLYNWYDWKLGMPLEVWVGSDYYSTVYTGYDLEIEENSDPAVVRIQCGKVRTALTKKLARTGM